MQPAVDMPDLDVWLALSSSEHPHRSAALAYWRDLAGEKLAFCCITSLGLLRLLTNSTVMDGQPLTAKEAWGAYQFWRSREFVIALHEEPEHETALADWIERGVVSSRLWTDAYLASLAVAAGHRIVSFDDDFLRFEGLDFLHLKA